MTGYVYRGSRPHQPRSLIRRWEQRPSGPMARVTDVVLAESNEARQASAAKRTVAAARRALPLREVLGLNQLHVDVLQARVDHPDDSLVELAVRLQVSKNAVASRIRRILLRLAEYERTHEDAE